MPRWRAGYHRMSDDAVLRHEFERWDDAVTDAAGKLSQGDVDHAWVRAPDGKLFWTSDSVDWEHPRRNPLYRHITLGFWDHLNRWLVRLILLMLFMAVLAVVGGSLVLTVYYLVQWL